MSTHFKAGDSKWVYGKSPNVQGNGHAQEYLDSMANTWQARVLELESDVSELRLQRQDLLDRLDQAQAMSRGMTEDERTVMHMIRDKLMGEGRREYGALTLSTDRRSVEELEGEALDEGLDALVYLVMALMKRGR